MPTSRLIKGEENAKPQTEVFASEVFANLDLQILDTKLPDNQNLVEFSTDKDSANVMDAKSRTPENQELQSSVKKGSGRADSRVLDPNELTNYKEKSEASIQRLRDDHRKSEISENKAVSNFKQEMEDEVLSCQKEAQDEIRELEEAHLRQMKEIEREMEQRLAEEKKELGILENVEKSPLATENSVKLESPLQDTKVRNGLSECVHEIENARVETIMKQQIDVVEPQIQIPQDSQRQQDTARSQAGNETCSAELEEELHHANVLEEIRRYEQKRMEQERRRQEEARRRGSILWHIRKLFFFNICK